MHKIRLSEGMHRVQDDIEDILAKMYTEDFHWKCMEGACMKCKECSYDKVRKKSLNVYVIDSDHLVRLVGIRSLVYSESD